MNTDNQQIRILVVDDEEAICGVLSASLKDEGYTVETAHDGNSAIQTISSFRPNIVLLDIWMPGDIDGIEVLRRAKVNSPSCHFIMMSGHGTIETAVKSTKLGAWDFVEKPLSIDKISIIIQNILNFQSERNEKLALLSKLRRNIALVGDSNVMKDLKQMVARVAPTNSWVLITGENGTGKELVAQNIHYLSSRASRPFVDINCAAIPAELIESELFGYEKGAFTGADKQKKGKFDHAHGGTLFLDEIGEMSLEAQAKILRILQEKKFQRVGGSQTIEVDVRVIAATNRNLDDDIKAGRFREDLFHRLNVIPVHMPSLKERREDVGALVNHFGETFVREGGYGKKILSDQAYEKMQSYNWPGNVRELRNFVERLYILTPGDFVDVHDLKIAGLQSDVNSQFNTESSFRKARAEFEKEFLIQKINENGGNISKTAEAIGLERSYLHRKIKAYGLDINLDRQ
jgi:two-component system, NtrC family, nitrogen regulation response regulator NtrX